MLTPQALAAALGLPRPTDEQAAVIAAPARPALVVAGAGAGKTETMAARVVWLVATGQVLPEQVLGLTFTRKAAQQLGVRVRTRLRRLAGSRLLDELDPTGARRAAVLAGEPTVATYHAYAGRLVGEHALRLPAEPGVAAARQHRRLAARPPGGQHLGGRPGRRPGARHRHRLRARARRRARRAPRRARGGPRPRRGARRAARRGTARSPAAGRAVAALPAVARRRSGCGTRSSRWWRRSPPASAPSARSTSATSSPIAARVAAEHPEVGIQERGTYRAVLLDEYQDTGHAQRVLLRALFGAAPSAPAGRDAPAVTAVGDPCQSIYGWRGASAGNLTRFRTDFPGPGRVARRRVRPAHQLPQPAAGARAGERRVRAAARGTRRRRGRRAAAGPGTAEGDVRVALLPDVAAELDWMADAVAAQWRAAADAGDEPPTSAVLVRRRADMDAVAAALRARDLPVEVVGLGGLLDTPEVRDLVSALRLVADPLAGPAAVRLLTGPRWRLGVADLAALWARARELAPGPPSRPAPSTAAELALGALPGEHAEQAGLVDALDDPGEPGRYSPAGFARIRRLATELRRLRARASVPLTDLVADTERLLLLDAETAARPGPVGRAHLDAFADVVADFAAGAEVSTAAGAARLPRHRRAGRRRVRARARSRWRRGPRPGPHRARGEGPGVGDRGGAAPRRAGLPRPQDQRKLADGPGGAARPAARRRRGPPGARDASPGRGPQGGRGRARRRTTRRSTTGGWSRSAGCSTWRSPGPSACCSRPGTGGGRPATGRRQPSVFLRRGSRHRRGDGRGARRALGGGAGVRGREPGHRGAGHGRVAGRPARRAARRGARRRRAGPRGPACAGRARCRADAGPADAPSVGRARRPQPRRPTPRAGPPTSTCCSPSAPPPASAPVVALPAQLSVSRLVELAADPGRARRAAAPPAAAAAEPARPPRHGVPRLARAAVRGRPAARRRRAARRGRRGGGVRRPAGGAAGGVPRLAVGGARARRGGGAVRDGHRRDRRARADGRGVRRRGRRLHGRRLEDRRASRTGPAGRR